MSSLLTYIHTMLGAPRQREIADAQLLTRFADCRDEAAFEGLVQRYGPLVFGVCRRLLANPHDAEDAFQATFLVLARKAGSVGKRELVGSWLYGVAHRIARKARATIARRAAREKQASVMPSVEPGYETTWHELSGLFDDEVARLPKKYRLPIVLCYFEGKPKAEIARQLGWPEGTVSARLTRGREMLRIWLTRKGVAPATGLFATMLSADSLSSAVPPTLISSTAKAAVAFATGTAAAEGAVSASAASLAKGALQSMFYQRVRMTLAIIVVMGLAGFGAVVAYQNRAEPPQALVDARGDDSDPPPQQPNPQGDQPQNKIKLYITGASAPRPGVHAVETGITYRDVLRAAEVDLDKLRAQGQVAYLIQLRPGSTGTPVSVSGELTKMIVKDNEHWGVLSDPLPKDPNAPLPRLTLWVGTSAEWDALQRSTRQAKVIAGKDAEKRAAEFRKQGIPARAVTADGGFWPLQYEELMSLAEKAEAAKKKWPGGESFLIGAADDAKLRKLVQDFVQAAVTGDNATYGKLYPGRTPQGLKSTIANLKRIAAEGGVPGESRLVESAKDRAIVISDFFAFEDNGRPRRMVCLVYDLRRDKENWSIRDIDVRDVEGLVNEVRRFDRRKEPGK